MRCACIDIGSNTTRLLVAECDDGHVVEVHQDRAFTHLGRALARQRALAPEKIAEVTEVISRQFDVARELGCADVRAVATAAIRRALNGVELVSAVRGACGLDVEMLTDAEEARLAFVGAARTLDHRPQGELGVVDVGGGSSELVLGQAPDRVSWWTSFGLGSGILADAYLRSDPPSDAQLSEARGRVRSELVRLAVRHPSEAVAVGGSAASLRTIAGPRLDRAAFARSLALLLSQPADELAERLGLHAERVKLLPAGLLILEAAAERFGCSLQVARGGLREGVLLEVSGA